MIKEHVLKVVKAVGGTAPVRQIVQNIVMVDTAVRKMEHVLKDVVAAGGTPNVRANVQNRPTEDTVVN